MHHDVRVNIDQACAMQLSDVLTVTRIFGIEDVKVGQGGRGHTRRKNSAVAIREHLRKRLETVRAAHLGNQ